MSEKIFQEEKQRLKQEKIEHD